MKHLASLKDIIRQQPITAPPSPWKHIASVAIGGLHAVGFDRNSELLLVISSQGRGVIDCRTGEKIARDYDEYYENRHLEIEGIGPLQKQNIRVSGLCGGGMPQQTEDGWSLEPLSLDWPIQEIMRIDPWEDLYSPLRGKPVRFHKIASLLEMRSFGFSYSGQSFIIATSSEIDLFCRL